MRTTEFKDTELGPIPKDWEVRRVGECCDILTGNVFDSKGFVSSGVKICGGLIIDPRGIKWSECKYWPSVTGLEQYLLKEDDVVVALDRPWISDGTKVGLIKATDLPCLLIQRTVRLRSDFVDSLWLIALLMGDEFRTHCVPTGSILPHISHKDISTFEIPLPPLPEQRRIAAALGDVDKLIENLKKRVEKKRNLKRGAMQELLTGKWRLKGFTGAWVEKHLGEMLKIGNGRDYKHLGAGDVPVYGTGGLMTYVDDFLFKGATVCFGRKGTIDEPQYHEGKIWTVDTLYFTYDFIDTDPKWLYYRSLLIDWLSYNTASGVPSLTARAICGISVSVPPLPEQRAIAAVLSDMDAEIANLEAKLKKMTLLKQGMMQDLLTGKVRLV